VSGPRALRRSLGVLLEEEGVITKEESEQKVQKNLKA
jgi:hypothetical protein